MDILKRSTRGMSACVACCVLLSSCAGMPGSPRRSDASGSAPDAAAANSDTAQPATPEERIKKQTADFNRTLAEGAAIGAIAGGVIGAVTGVIFGGKTGLVIGGVAGTAAGGALGALAGTYYANKKEDYATQEAQFDAMIKDAQSDNAKAEALVNDSHAIAEADQQKLNAIKANLAKKRISRAQAQTELAAVDSNRELLNQSLASLTKRRDQWKATVEEARKDADAPQLAALDTEVKRMDKQIALMQRELDALNSRRASIIG